MNEVDGMKQEDYSTDWMMHTRMSTFEYNRVPVSYYNCAPKKLDHI